MKKRLKLFFFITLSFQLSLSATLEAGSWAKNKVWNDGRAEVAVYESQRIVYGKTRSFREQLITVKEEFVKETLVKADKGKKGKTFPVFKLNLVQKFDTENYPYSYLTSVFVDAKKMDRLVKMTVGSQEWCGNTFKIYKQKSTSRSGQMQTFSYFDGEGDQQSSFPFKKGDFFEDQLPLSLRDLPFAKGFEKKIRLYAHLTNNHAKAPHPEECLLKVVGEEVIRTHAGSIPSWKLTLTRPQGTDTYWFAKDKERILTKMETHDGRTRRLYAKVRWAYWDKRFPMPKILE